MNEISCSPTSAAVGVHSKAPVFASNADPGGKPAAVMVAVPVAETRKRPAVAGRTATLPGASKRGPEETTAKLSRTVFSPALASRNALSLVASGSATTSKRMVVWPRSACNVCGTLRRLELLVMEIAAAREVPEGESRNSHTPLIPGGMRLVQASDTRLVVKGKLWACTVNVKIA